MVARLKHGSAQHTWQHHEVLPAFFAHDDVLCYVGRVPRGSTLALKCWRVCTIILSLTIARRVCGCALGVCVYMCLLSSCVIVTHGDDGDDP